VSKVPTPLYHLNSLVTHLALAILSISVILLAEAAPLFPNTLAHLTLCVSVGSFSMLEAVSPHAVEYTPISPSQDTMALFLIVDE